MMKMLEEDLRLALPKGRMEEGVCRLLADAGIKVTTTGRTYRPQISLEGVEVKLLKPQNIVEMLQLGSRDIGFAGADWVAELQADVVEILDTGLDPVRIVVAAPQELKQTGLSRVAAARTRPLVVATEYENLAKSWLRTRGLSAQLLRSYGATEVFPPEDADLIVDNTATGATLRAGNLEIIEVLMCSSTRLYANRKTLDDRRKRQRIDEITLVLRSVLDARKRAIIEVNVDANSLEQVAAALPSMRRPTISTLHAEAGYAVKAAVPRETLPALIPLIKSLGGTDIVVSGIAQVVP